MIDEKQRKNFHSARLSALKNLNNQDQDDIPFSTISEGSLHSVLKYWAEPDEKFHEISVDIPCDVDEEKTYNMVADICKNDHITEIQTTNFTALRKKLNRLLLNYPVTVIYPVTKVKRIIWVDPKSGETTPPRKSPKEGTIWDAFIEFSRMCKHIPNPDFDMKIVFLEEDQYRLRNGWSKDGKRGSRRLDRIPKEIFEIVHLDSIDAYKKLLPSDLPDPFTTRDISEILKVRQRLAGTIVYVMYNIGAIIRTGKRGNAYLYKKSSSGN